MWPAKDASFPRDSLPLLPSEEADERGAQRLKTIGLILFISGVFAVALFVTVSRPGGVAPPQTHVAVLVDPTDTWSPRQWGALRADMHRWRDTLAEGDRLSLFVLNPKDGRAVQTYFSARKPRDGTGANTLVENAKRMRARYAKQFADPLKAALGRLAQVPPANRSPILQALWEVVNSARFSGADRVVLVVWSDCLENTPELSHFQNAYSFAEVQRRHAAYVEELAGLRGAQVTVYLLQNRWARRQTRAHAQFWADYFTAAGVAGYEVKRL